MSRISKNGLTVSQKLCMAWEGKWPPEVGEKVKLWKPSDLRGKAVNVIASGTEFKRGVKPALKDKIRVSLPGGNQKLVYLTDVFPKELKIKDIENLSMS